MLVSHALPKNEKKLKKCLQYYIHVI